MKKRLITGTVLVLILVPLVVIEQLFPIFQAVCAFFVCVGAYEMIHLYERGKKYSWRVKGVIIFSTLLTYLSGMAIWNSDQIKLGTVTGDIELYAIADAKIAIALLLVSIVLQLSLLVFSKTFDANDIGKSLTTSFYVGFGVASILALRIMGVRFIVYLFLITTMTDIFAYVFGMLFGKHKMIERISPKKTWEGAIGGTVVATVVATLFAFMYSNLFGVSFNQDGCGTIFDVFSGVGNIPAVAQFFIILCVTLLASIVSQIGDLVASRLKRTYDIKDFGNIFPGHGGFLDRFDSSILTAMFLLGAFLLVNVFVAEAPADTTGFQMVIDFIRMLI